jgi:hypothetical protein
VINNRVNVSRYKGAPPSDSRTGFNRKIVGGPLYPASEVTALAEQGSLNFWTRGALEDAQKWKIDAIDASSLLRLALKSGRFLGAEWCEQKPSGPWAACDAYTITRQEWNQAAHKHIDCTYYLKFAISKTGQVLLMASNHPAGA